jgi:hypothetical protein
LGWQIWHEAHVTGGVHLSSPGADRGLCAQRGLSHGRSVCMTPTNSMVRHAGKLRLRPWPAHPPAHPLASERHLFLPWPALLPGMDSKYTRRVTRVFANSCMQKYCRVRREGVASGGQCPGACCRCVAGSFGDGVLVVLYEVVALHSGITSSAVTPWRVTHNRGHCTLYCRPQAVVSWRPSGGRVQGRRSTPPPHSHPPDPPLTPVVHLSYALSTSPRM